MLGNKGSKKSQKRDSGGSLFCGLNFRHNLSNKEWNLKENWVEINVGDENSSGSVVYLNIETNEVSDDAPLKNKPLGTTFDTAKTFTSTSLLHHQQTKPFVVKSLGNMHIDDKCAKAAKLNSTYALKLVNDIFNNKSLMNEIPRLSDHSLVMEITGQTVVIVDPSNGEIHTAIPINELINFAGPESKKNKFGLITSMTSADSDGDNSNNYFILLFTSQKPWCEISKLLINGKMQQSPAVDSDNLTGASMKVLRSQNGVALRQKAVNSNSSANSASKKIQRMSSSSTIIKSIILNYHANSVNELFAFMGNHQFKADAKQVCELLKEMKRVGKKLLESSFDSSKCRLIMKKEERQLKFVDLDSEDAVVSLEITNFKTAYINGEKNGMTIGCKLDNTFQIYAFKSSGNVERAYEIIKMAIQMTL